MNPVMFMIGDFEIRWYSLFILIGVILAYSYFEYEGSKYKLSKDFIFNLTFWTVIFGLVGARIYYVIFNWSLYSHDLLSILKFWEGGLAIHGGIFAGLLTILLYCKKYKIKLIQITDYVVPGLILAQAIGRWGNFFNSEAHGAATTMALLKDKLIPIPQFVIDGMNIGGTYYEPTFYYESLWCILGFIVLLVIKSRKKLKIGTLTGTYLMWYSFGRFFIESSRTDSLMLGGLKMAQVVSILLFVIGLIIVVLNIKKSSFDDNYHENNFENVKF